MVLKHPKTPYVIYKKKKKELKAEVTVTLANCFEIPRAEPNATKAHELVRYKPSQL